MNSRSLIDRLERFARVLPPLVQNLPIEEARFKPPSGAWSILEIVCHLADEETDDFRARLRLTLESSDEEWSPIDPERFALDRCYNTQNPKQVIDRFVHERCESIAWLRSLHEPDWSLARPHKVFGKISAGDILAAWPAHDALHLRQIAKRLYELAGRDGDPHPTAYAGEWEPAVANTASRSPHHAMGNS